MTAPASSKKKRKITRRNTWPADSPRKLNPRKKYQQRFRNRDFPEPFWTDTYEWLVMRNSPEQLRSAPMARMAEFVEVAPVRNLSPSKAFEYKPSRSLKPMKEITSFNPLLNSNCPEVIGFYFTTKPIPSKPKDPKSYLAKLKKRCYEGEARPYSIPGVNFTNFVPQGVSAQSRYFDDFAVSSFAAYDRHNFSADDVDAFRDAAADPFQEMYHHQSTVPGRYFRPLQSANFGGVMAQNAARTIGGVEYMRHKGSQNIILRNKENIKMNNRSSFPNSKFSDYKGNVVDTANAPVKKYFKPPPPRKSLNKPEGHGYKLPKDIENKRAPMVGGELPANKLPKDIDKNRPNISHAPKNVSQTGPGNVGKVESGNPEASSSAPTPQSGHVASESSSSGDPSGSGQGSKPYLRQLFEKDIQSHFAMSAKATKNLESGSKDEEEKSKRNPERKNFAGSASSKSGTKSNVSSLSSAVPSDVIGFDFLKTLHERAQLEEASKEAKFPASAIGYAFLNTLVEQQSKGQDSKAAEKAMSFSKSLAEEEKPQEQSLPASVIGQAFLKNLLTSQSEMDKPDSEQQLRKDQPLPSFVVGQAFLKTLADANQYSSKPQAVPSAVVGQTFLKSLIQEDRNSCSLKQEDAAQPSSNVGGVYKSSSESSILAPVVGQEFIKTLLESQNQELGSKDVNLEKLIPSSVIGQPFLKSLSRQYDEKSEKSSSLPVSDSPVPANVLGQVFLKSLIEQNEEESEKSSDSIQAIPAPVISQAFLKSLLGDPSRIEDPVAKCSSTSSAETESATASSADPIPSSVVGQAFLKYLVGTELPEASLSDSSKTIPSAVARQAFLKSLLESNTSCSGSGVETEESKSNIPLPANVIGQSFLKSLVEQSPNVDDESAGSRERKSIPASVVGQAFLKSLVEQEPTVDDSSKPVPSSVIGQSFLKSLVEQSATCADKSSDPIPSEVVGQSFLKALLTDSSLQESGSSDKSVPASVVGQSFLKSLLTEAIEPQCRETCSKTHSTTATPLLVGQSTAGASSHELPSSFETDIPASVIGSAFLKTLSEQPLEGPSATQTPDSKAALPANVVGQAFLKTLLGMEADSTSAAEIEPPEDAQSSSQLLPTDTANGSGKNGHDSFSGVYLPSSDAFAVDSAIDDSIIPPPPEFCETSSVVPLEGVAGTSGDAAVTSGIIGELLNYTKMMHSVIESMHDSSGASDASGSKDSHRKHD